MIRLDKWLWAARFFKTRSIAKTALDGGKIHCNGVRAKTSKNVNIGDKFIIRQGFEYKEVVVTGLSDKRGKAADAALLYEETQESIKLREKNKLIRKMQAPGIVIHEKPNKKQRRQIVRFKQSHID